MIPRHKPPFSFLDSAKILLFGYPVTKKELEKSYCDQLGVKHAILLPSARVGIYYFLKKHAATHELIAPAFTCGVVHEAIIKSGIKFKLSDNAPGCFLMEEDVIIKNIHENNMLLLCELYGLNYSDNLFFDERTFSIPKIHDLAMTVPEKEMMKRLGDQDIAILSFGIGKCLFAGSGGLVITNNDHLAEYFNSIVFKRLSVFQIIKKNVEVLIRTVAHNNIIYGLSRKVITIARKNTKTIHPAENNYPVEWANFHHDPDYLHLPTAFIRKLIKYNLSHSLEYISKRKSLLKSYVSGINKGIIQQGIHLNHYCLSHLPILCPDIEIREKLIQLLWLKGIDCARLYSLGSYISGKIFPNAVKTSQTIICLPVNMDLNKKDEYRIWGMINNELSTMNEFKQN